MILDTMLHMSDPKEKEKTEEEKNQAEEELLQDEQNETAGRMIQGVEW